MYEIYILLKTGEDKNVLNLLISIILWDKFRHNICICSVHFNLLSSWSPRYLHFDTCFKAILFKVNVKLLSCSLRRAIFCSEPLNIYSVLLMLTGSLLFKYQCDASFIDVCIRVTVCVRSFPVTYTEASSANRLHEAFLTCCGNH